MELSGFMSMTTPACTCDCPKFECDSRISSVPACPLAATLRSCSRANRMIFTMSFTDPGISTARGCREMMRPKSAA
jgi:hypothetical protein